MSKELKPDFPVFTVKGEGSAYMLMREMEPDTDNQGRKYEMVTQTLEDDDFYQGLNMITVIRRLSDGKIFGYSWFDDISKHGESYIEPNGDEFGLEFEVDDDDEDFDWDNDYESYYVFEPVAQSYIVTYEKVK